MRCPYCGVELIETANGLMCPNDGLMTEEKEGESDSMPSYFG